MSEKRGADRYNMYVHTYPWPLVLVEVDAEQYLQNPIMLGATVHRIEHSQVSLRRMATYPYFLYSPTQLVQ